MEGLIFGILRYFSIIPLSSESNDPPKVGTLRK